MRSHGFKVLGSKQDVTCPIAASTVNPHNPKTLKPKTLTAVRH